MRLGILRDNSGSKRIKGINGYCLVVRVRAFDQVALRFNVKNYIYIYFNVLVVCSSTTRIVQSGVETISRISLILGHGAT